jgi:hypothetical protein
MKLDIKAFVNSYLVTAAWVTCDSGTENHEFTKQAKLEAEADCLNFIGLVKKVFGEEKAEKLLTIKGNDLDYLAPHDFFLTRNGHGTGFWDKEDVYGEEEADKLTDISKKLGTVDCIHEDDEDKNSKLIFF